ncbi:MAG: Preprotein translocase, SecE subunit [Parcubacteria group bacterium GW2011_GWA2_38_13]|nr:MAG: Preprotein translocase, SecE subunit [Parcubacteria group bacterium GW2011_GWA2_38_13]
MNIASKLIDYLKLSKVELKKVIWPDKKTTMNHTILVIGFSLGVAFFLGIMDRLFTILYEALLK